MINKLRVRAQSESGFTLVELLVVMLILGLLAAIAIPAFFNQRDKAKDSDAKEAVRTAQTAVETYQTDNNGSYTGATTARLQAIEPTLNDVPVNTATGFSVTPSASGKGYVVVAQSTTGNRFTITRADTGQSTYTCTAVSTAGCPSSGNWGS
jgi:type IV pilus assembly protein PilA